MGVLSNRVPREDLKPGDHIYSWRFVYSYAHHGIYIGDGNVIHFTRGQGQELGTGTFLDNFLSMSGSSPSHGYGPCAKCGLNTDSDGVLLSCLDCFLCGYPLYRFEYDEKLLVFLVKVRGGTCTLAASDPPNLVLHRAHHLLEHGFGCYNIFSKNCEDFAMYCRTGLIVLEGNMLGTSGQAGSFLGAPVAALTSTPVRLILSEPWSLVAVGATLYCVSRFATDLRNRRDVVKVSVEDLVSKLAPRVVAATVTSLPTTGAADSLMSSLLTTGAADSLPGTNGMYSLPVSDAVDSLPGTNGMDLAVRDDLSAELVAGESTIAKQQHNVDAQPV